MPSPKKKSLQDVLRERRAAAPLVSARQLHEREAARRREEIERQARELVERWRSARRAVDDEGKLAPDVYRAVFVTDLQAYYRSRHWVRRVRAQRTATPYCEVARCGGADGLRARHLNHEALGEEQRGRDLITLCEGCERRAVKLQQERGRLPTREEIRDLDPERPLFTPAEIAALKAKHRRPLLRSDLRQD